MQSKMLSAICDAAVWSRSRRLPAIAAEGAPPVEVRTVREEAEERAAKRLRVTSPARESSPTRDSASHSSLFLFCRRCQWGHGSWSRKTVCTKVRLLPGRRCFVWGFLVWSRTEPIWPPDSRVAGVRFCSQQQAAVWRSQSSKEGAERDSCEWLGSEVAAGFFRREWLRQDRMARLVGQESM